MATVEKRGDSYKITVSCGYDSSGKQIRRRMTWTPSPGMTPRQTEKELERQKVLFEEKCATGQFIDGNIKFADFAERWFKDYAEKQLRPDTIASYKIYLRRVLPALGHIRMNRLQPHHLISFYENLTEAGIREDIKYYCKVDFDRFLHEQSLSKTELSKAAGISVDTIHSMAKGKNVNHKSAEMVSKALGISITAMFEPVGKDTLSANSIKHYHAMLSSICSIAVQWQVITANPCERVKPPKVEKKDPRYMDEVQAAQLLEALQQEKNEQYKTMVKLLLFTGMRRGELCGLEWPDIDFEHSVIHIRRSSQYLPAKGIFEDSTKTYSSIRTIKASSGAMEMLKSYKRWQDEQRLMLGSRWKGSNRLFTSQDGGPIYPGLVSGWLKKFIKKNNLPDICIHSLRHTNASLQISGGVPLPTIAGRLGHATSATTSTIYAHAIKSADEAAAEMLNDLLSPNKNKTAKIG